MLCMQLIRDAEALPPSDVATLPAKLHSLYASKDLRIQQTVLQHPLFEILRKPWALQPTRLTPQVRLIHRQVSLPVTHSSNYLKLALCNALRLWPKRWDPCFRSVWGCGCQPLSCLCYAKELPVLRPVAVPALALQSLTDGKQVLCMGKPHVLPAAKLLWRQGTSLSGHA